MSPGTKATVFAACIAATSVIVGIMAARGAPLLPVGLAAALSLGVLFVLLRGAGRS